MTRMTRPDCAVMCNLINTHTHTHTHTERDRYGVRYYSSAVRHLLYCLAIDFQSAKCDDYLVPVFCFVFVFFMLF